MTSERTWRVGARFYKRVNNRAEAARLIDRARQISQAGANTPEPEYCPDQNALTFRALDGTTGVELVDGAALSELLRPLQSIHHASIPDLPLYDPFAKIAPRLKPGAPQWLTDRVARLQKPAPDQSGIIHGDFHCGQLIRDLEGRVWIIDLEDLSLGPIEADLGNFAAHFATRPETSRANLLESLRHWSGRVCDAWSRLGEPCDPALFWRAVDIALIRRALKLWNDRGELEVLRALQALPLFSRQTEL